MKNTSISLLSIAVLLFTACGSNQDLASLNEYDDIYYTGGDLTASINDDAANYSGAMSEASNAEQSYYQDQPYEPAEDATPASTAPSDQDYYDADYARRIQNFHGANQNSVYQDPYGNYNGFGNNGGFANPQPQVNYNFGIGYSNFGFGPYSSFGFGYGNFNRFGAFGYDPFYRPFCPHPFYGCNPYFGGFNYGFYDPFYRPFSPYGFGYSPFYANSFYGNGFYGNGFYGNGGFYGAPTAPYYGSVDHSGVPSTTYSSRNNIARPSRGGVIKSQEQVQVQEGPKSSSTEVTRRNDRSGAIENVNVKSRDTEVSNSPTRNANRDRSSNSNLNREVVAPREVSPQTDSRQDYFAPNESTRYNSRSVAREKPSSSTTPRTYPSNRNAGQRQTPSPYIHQREQQRAVPKGNSTPSRSIYTPNRSRSNQTGRSSRSAPTTSPGRSQPSYSPSSPSRGGSGGRGGTSSPSPSRRR